MKIVVTGGSGQLGTLVLERLATQRKIKKIISLDLTPPIVPSARIDWRIADMRDPGLERHLEGADALIHLAFIVVKAASVETMRAVNVEGSRRIFEAAAQHGLRRIVYASSVGAYGIASDHPPSIVESTPRRPSPLLTYADNKYEVEAHLDSFEARHPEIAVVRLRPGVLLGRRVTHLGESPGARTMPVFGDARVPIVWDEDVADAVVRSLDDGVRGAFNLVASEPVTLREMARLAGLRTFHVPPAAARLASRASNILAPLLGEKRLDAGWIDAARLDMCVSADKARAELGWKPRYPTSADVAIAFGKSARRGTDRRIASFFSILPRFARRAASEGELADRGRMKLVLYIDVTGPTGGDFTLTLDDGKVTLKSGIPRPPTSTVSLSAETLLDLLAGRGEAATATLVGKIKVRGEPMGNIVMTGIIDGFRRAVGAEGVQGKVARGLARWFEREIES